MRGDEFNEGIGMTLLGIVVIAMVYLAGSTFTKARIETDCNTVGVTILHGNPYECSPLEEVGSG